MKTQTRNVIVVVAAVLIVAAGLAASIMLKYAKKQDAPTQGLAVSDVPDILDTAVLYMAEDTVDPGATLPQFNPPVLTIGGREDSSVYLQSLDIQVEVTGSIASTRYTMVFKNRTGRILEGMLTFPLPDGRSVTYYALDINGKMREAVPVEKAKGTEVFEEIEQRRVDPGLLERVEGNNFRTRIYPIPAGGTRTVAIGYEEELALEKDFLRYNLPMAYGEPLEKFAVKATVWRGAGKPFVPKSENELRFDAVEGNYVASFARENYSPARALVFALSAPPDIPRVLMQPAQGAYYFLASVAPKMETRKKLWGDTLAIIRDVSLSGLRRDLRTEAEMLDILFADKKNAVVHLYYLNNRLTRIVNKNTGTGEYKVADGKWEELKNTLDAAVFDGGTDFSQINPNNIVGNEILFFSDGISTLGDADFIRDDKTGRPVHCVVSSATADYGAMRLIAGKTKGKFINVNSLSPEKIKTELLDETPLFLGAEYGKSIREVYPNIAVPIHGDFSVAGISGQKEAELTLLFGFGDSVEKRLTVKLDAKSAGNQTAAHKIWAQKKIAELDLNFEKNRAELTELGQQFGIVTRNTSLIVLETVDDYIRYGIKPPAAEPGLLAEYRRKTGGGRKEPRGNGWEDRGEERTARLVRWGEVEAPAEGNSVTSGGVFGKGGFATDIDAILSNFRGLQAPGQGGGAKNLKSAEGSRTGGGIDELLSELMDGGDGGFELKKKGENGDRSRAGVRRDVAQDMSARGEEERRENARREAESLLRMKNVTMLKIAAEAAKDIKKWWNTDLGRFSRRTQKYPVPDDAGRAAGASAAKGGFAENNPYKSKLTGKPADDYQIYLKTRANYANTPEFYFDMANWFYTLDDKETALRVLTSIADLELENASLYKLLGYRFKEYGEYALEKFVCKKVIQWRPMEPHSYRDYALALADNGETQAALDLLCSMLVKKTYSENIVERSRGIADVAVTEINRLLAKNANLNKSEVDKRLVTNVTADIRVVINWNMNNTDIDLHVIDPAGDWCYYDNRTTRIGGYMSGDITSGYGPEQFMLKKAIEGKYRVFVNYYGDTQVTAAGPSTIMAEIYTKYAGEAERRKVVCLQMSNVETTSKNEMAMVAEFEF